MSLVFAIDQLNPGTRYTENEQPPGNPLPAEAPSLILSTAR
jgi:hypothetical protein